MDQSFSSPLEDLNSPSTQQGVQQMPAMSSVNAVETNPFVSQNTQNIPSVVSTQTAAVAPMNNQPVVTPPVVEEPTNQNNAFYEEPKKSRSFLSLVFFFVFVGVVAFTGYLWYVRDNEQANNDRLVRSVDTIEQSIRDLQLKENVSYQVAAGDILLRAQEDRIAWSRIVDLILQYETVNIEFVNFSSNSDQQVFVTGKANSYEHIATLVDSFDGNTLIDSPFVSSITRREQRSSRSSLVSGPSLERNTIGFQLSFTYNEATPTP